MLTNNNQNRRVFYERQPNGRYRAVSDWDPDLMNSFRQGHTLVSVNKNTTTKTCLVHADHVALAAAAEDLRDQLVKILKEVTNSQAKSQTGKPLTTKQQKLWKQLEATGVSSVILPSDQDIVDKFLKKIQDRAVEVYDLPWVNESRYIYKTAIQLALSEKHHEQH